MEKLKESFGTFFLFSTAVFCAAIVLSGVVTVRAREAQIVSGEAGAVLSVGEKEGELELSKKEQSFKLSLSLSPFFEKAKEFAPYTPFGAAAYFFEELFENESEK